MQGEIDMGNKVKAFLGTLVIQLGFLVLFFIGGLLDPLIALWVAALYFFMIGSYLTYRCLLTHKFFKKSNELRVI